jgi:cytochrome c oxidase assembly protein Cox11
MVYWLGCVGNDDLEYMSRGSYFHAINCFCQSATKISK